MTDTQLADLFGSANTAPEPALAPGFVDGTLIRARRDVRRRRAVAIAVLGVVAALLATVTAWPVWGARPVPPAAPDTKPTLPREFAPFSLFTSTAPAHPGGRAIALYEQGSAELFHTWQTLVAGADQDTYRRVDYGDNAAPPVLLSPVGNHVLFTEPRATDDEFRMLDLTTGRSRRMASVHWTSNVGGGMRMLAWSWDERYVAYSVPKPPPGTGRATDSISEDGRVISELAILDTLTNISVRYPEISPVWSAAFAPDGRLAVQVGAQIWNVDPATGGQVLAARPTGQEHVLVKPATGLELVSGVGWSPDGLLLAVAPVEGGSQTVRFLDATGTARPVPADLTLGPMLGWRSPSSVVIQQWLDDEQRDALVEVNLINGNRTVLSRFSNNNSCEYGLQQCNVYRIQLAACLLMEAGLRDPDPDRGPYLIVVRLAAIAVTGVVVAGALWFIRRRAGRRVRSR
jgi:hypothetical protein